MNTRALTAALCTPLLALGLVACGSDEDKSEDGVIAAVEDYYDEFNDGDYDDACDRFTDDYADAMVEEWNEDDDFGTARTCSGVLSQGAVLLRAFGDLDEDDDVYQVEKISADVDGDTAVVSVAYKDDDSSTFSMVYDDGEWLMDEDLDEEDAEPSDTATEEAEPEAAAEPSAIGDSVELGDWTITITEVEKNANATIAKANEFNDAPKHQFVMLTYEAVYNGEERTASVDADLTWSLTTSDAQVLDPSSQVTPAENQNWPTTVRTSGTARGQVVFDVDPTLLDGGIVGIESYDADYDQIFVDFAL